MGRTEGKGDQKTEKWPMGVTTQNKCALTQRLDSKGLRPCIMHYHKDGCPKTKNGGTCYWSHDSVLTNAEKSTMRVIAGND